MGGKIHQCTHVVGRKCFHVRGSRSRGFSAVVRCVHVGEIWMQSVWWLCFCWIWLKQHLFNQWDHKGCFFGAWKLWKWDWLNILSFFLSLLFSLAHSLSPSIPYVLLLRNPAHITLYHPSFSLSNSPSLCSSEIRCSSLWAVREEGLSLSPL